jgi:hypothetical protein
VSIAEDILLSQGFAEKGAEEAEPFWGCYNAGIDSEKDPLAKAQDKEQSATDTD